jgi:SNF2 family DNA or RNA helicase
VALLTTEDFHPYQIRTIEHMMGNPQSMLFLDPGLGKSIITLTSIAMLLDQMKVYGVIVVAPLRVAQTVWRQEALKWAHTKHLTFSSITGSKDDRIRGLMTPADVYLINFDNLRWLQEEIEFRFLRKGKRPPFNMLVADEISKLKNTRTRQGAERGKAMLKLLPYLPYRTGLTGTPASNGMLDLFGQFLVIDSGQRLGTSFSGFRSTYFYQADYQGYRWLPFEKAKDQIGAKVGDITVNLSAEDYLDLPDKIVNDVYIDLPPKQRAIYDRIEHDMLVELDSGHEVEIFNGASLMNRCLQYANGGMYTMPGAPDWENVHDAKLDALDDIIEESAGKPVLIIYQYQHDAKKILKKYPDAVWLSSKISESDFVQAIEDWNSGKLTKIIGHPASMGFGVDGLQDSCHTMVWYGLPWGLDFYMQTIARLLRQGQEHPVMVHRLMMRDTVEEAVKIALENKFNDEHGAREAIAKYRSQCKA